MPCLWWNFPCLRNCRRWLRRRGSSRCCRFDDIINARFRRFENFLQKQFRVLANESRSMIAGYKQLINRTLALLQTHSPISCWKESTTFNYATELEELIWLTHATESLYMLLRMPVITQKLQLRGNQLGKQKHYPSSSPMSGWDNTLVELT